MSHLKRLEQMEKACLADFSLTMLGDHPSYWGSRAVLQMEYAHKLSQSEGGAHDEVVHAAIDTAWAAFQGEGALTRTACEAVEQALTPLVELAKGYRLLCIGHAHIDMNWMWGYDETVSITLDTFRTMLDLMDEYPDFTYAQSQASTYRIVEQHDPALLQRIKARVREGRWEVAASTWVEADRNMPNMESMARHFLYTKQYLSQLLDIDPASLNLDYEPDTFGHHINVPEVLCDGGVKYYYHCRGFEGEVLYNWKAPSGRSILMFREPTWYNWGMDGRCALEVPAFCKKHGLTSMLRVYGVGDHGGGPTRRDIEKILDMNRWPVFPVFEFSTYGAFFREAEANRDAYATVEGELNFIFDGCYTTQTRQKKGNRLGEAALADAEGVSALTHAALGTPYAAPAFADAWKKVLFNQFHDILPGSGVTETREYAMGQYQEAMATANTQRQLAVRALSAAGDTSSFAVDEDTSRTRSEGAGVGFGLSAGRLAQVGRHAGLRRLFTVYNPLPFARCEAVPVTVWDWSGDPKRMRWTNAQGQALEHQVTGHGRNDYWGHFYAEALVRADVPAMGYTTIVLDEAAPADVGPAIRDPRVFHPQELVLRNEFLCAHVCPQDGFIYSLVDLRTGAQYAAPGKPLGVFQRIEEDTSRGMSAWVVGQYRKVESLCDSVRFTDVQVGEHLLRQSVRFEKDFGNDSLLTVTVSLDRGEAMLRLDATVRWQEIGTRQTVYPQLNVLLPLNYACDKVRYDVPMGVSERPKLDHDVPAQSFGVALAQGGRSLMLVNDSKYGYRASKEGLSLTLIRSSDEPDPWPEVGEHRIRMGIALVEDDAAAQVALSQAFNHGLSVAAAKAHGGTLPARAALLELSGGVALSAVKLSEDGAGLIVRYYELQGKSGEAELKFHGVPKSACAVNVLEQQVGGDVTVEGNAVRFGYRANGVGSIKVLF